MMSSALLHGPCTPSGSCGLMGCRSQSALQQVFRAVIVSKLTYAAPAWWGFTTSTDRQRIDDIFRRANKSGHLTLLQSRLSVHQLTTNFSPKLLHTLTIYYIHFCHRCQPPLNPTALDGAYTHINSLDIQPIFRTVTYSPACCTKTPIRHYLSFYCSVCVLGECFLMTVWCSLLCSAVCCVCISGCLFYILFIGCVLSCQFYNKIELN